MTWSSRTVSNWMRICAPFPGGAGDPASAVGPDDRPGGVDRRAAGRRATLPDVPASAWDDVTPAGTDAVWLMGVWERSPAGLELANANAGLQASFRDALPDPPPDDVIGSPHR